MRKYFRTLQDLDLEIQESNINGVILRDKGTGYPVAHFFNQAGADGKPQYDSLELANKFILLSELLKAIKNEANQTNLR